MAFDQTVEYDNIFLWIDVSKNSQNIINDVGAQDAYYNLASVSPKEVSSLLSCLFALNNIKWKAPFSDTSFKLDKKYIKENEEDLRGWGV